MGKLRDLFDKYGLTSVPLIVYAIVFYVFLIPPQAVRNDMRWLDHDNRMRNFAGASVIRTEILRLSLAAEDAINGNMYTHGSTYMPEAHLKDIRRLTRMQYELYPGPDLGEDEGVRKQIAGAIKGLHNMFVKANMPHQYDVGRPGWNDEYQKLLAADPEMKELATYRSTAMRTDFWPLFYYLFSIQNGAFWPTILLGLVLYVLVAVINEVPIWTLFFVEPEWTVFYSFFWPVTFWLYSPREPIQAAQKVCRRIAIMTVTIFSFMGPSAAYAQVKKAGKDGKVGADSAFVVKTADDAIAGDSPKGDESTPAVTGTLVTSFATSYVASIGLAPTEHAVMFNDVTFKFPKVKRLKRVLFDIWTAKDLRANGTGGDEYDVGVGWVGDRFSAWVTAIDLAPQISGKGGDIIQATATWRQPIKVRQRIMTLYGQWNWVHVTDRPSTNSAINGQLGLTGSLTNGRVSLDADLAAIYDTGPFGFKPATFARIITAVRVKVNNRFNLIPFKFISTGPVGPRQHLAFSSGFVAAF